LGALAYDAFTRSAEELRKYLRYFLNLPFPRVTADFRQGAINRQKVF
jgi:hypothetical protein